MEDILQRQWGDHLQSCTLCAAEMDGWRLFRNSLKRPHLESAPEFMLASAVALFQPPAKAAERSKIRTIFANLIYDSFAQPAFAGARGETATRQVILRAEEFDIHVRISAIDETRELLGQIQPRSSRNFTESARLHLLQNGERVSSAEVNELGEFHFSYIPEGFLSLQIDLPHLTVIGAIDVSERI